MLNDDSLQLNLCILLKENQHLLNLAYKTKYISSFFDLLFSLFLYFFLIYHHLDSRPNMEAEDQQYRPHYINLSEGNPSRNDNFNLMFLQNPNDEDFHVHDHVYNHEHYHHDHQPNVVMDQEKRLRRLVSNRESARRSRMRERKRIEGMQMQVQQLMVSNQFLSNKYISLLEYNHQILQENSQLKDTVSSFQQYTIFHAKHDDMLGNVNDFDLNQQSPYQPT